MEKQIKGLEKFQTAFNSTYNEKPTLLTKEESELRYKLLKEENEEYLEACLNNDLVEVADAITDQLFLVVGNAVSHGMGDILTDMFEEVLASNMSKLGEDGNPVINGENGIFDARKPFGKILKGKNYFEPNLEQFLK